MWTLALLIGVSFFAGLAGWYFFVRSVKRGHYDDVEGPKYRMLDDEDE